MRTANVSNAIGTAVSANVETNRTMVTVASVSVLVHASTSTLAYSLAWQPFLSTSGDAEHHAWHNRSKGSDQVLGPTSQWQSNAPRAPKAFRQKGIPVIECN